MEIVFTKPKPGVLVIPNPQVLLKLLTNYANITYQGKWLLIWCMLLGRLEIYTIIILLVPEFWRK